MSFWEGGGGGVVVGDLGGGVGGGGGVLWLGICVEVFANSRSC